jgi:tRNA(adenine34) deaminase
MLKSEHWMREALKRAGRARSEGEVPVGAVVVHEGQLVGEGWNRPIGAIDPTAHAEVLALRDAARALGDYRMAEADLFVTLEPCVMCAGAIVHARLRRVIFGAYDPKAGAAGSAFNILENPAALHRPAMMGGVLAEECGALLREFFTARRGGAT